MTTNERTYKEEVAAELKAENLDGYRLHEIDARLDKYVREVVTNDEAHNVYELLAVKKFLRLKREYTFKVGKVQKFAKFYEGLKFSGMDGRRCYKLTPVQYFQFANMLGFYRWEYVGETDEADRVSATEKVEDGKRYAMRRLCREAILFVPRKFSKTTSTASLAVNELLIGDSNAQAYTAANSYKQAKICFKEISSIVRQLDPRNKYFKATRETLTWRPNELGKESFVECLTGGADSKDGLNASLVIFDEYAQAKYVKDHSEGAELMQVLTSSMGMRREPMTVIITTASRVEDGPFSIELENAKKILTGEFHDDSQFAHLFMPDEWEMDGDKLGDPALWRKCNPHIGITVQESYYQRQWEKAQRDAEVMLEFKCKLLNIFVAGGVKIWMPKGLLKNLQVDIDMESIQGRPMTMCAMDLSVSDDFSVVAYNIYSHLKKKFYVDIDCYIPEETLKEHPNKELYKVWIANGWLKVCPGAVISDRMIVEDVLRRSKRLNILQVGYDAYKSQEVMNALRAAVSSMGNDPDKILRAVPQNYGAFTSPVETFEMAAKREPAKVALSKNPILPYCFTNCYIDEDKNGNKKPLKRKENLKIDAAVATLMTFWLYNNFEQT